MAAVVYGDGSYWRWPRLITESALTSGLRQGDETGGETGRNYGSGRRSFVAGKAA